MLRRCLMALLVALPMLLIRPEASHALSCLPPESRIAEMDLVVEARIVSLPKAHWAQFEVDRYLKGSGPASILVEFRGTGVDYLWAIEPQLNQAGIFELSLDERGYAVNPCGLVVDKSWGDYDGLRRQFGEGTEPTAEAPKPVTEAPKPGTPDNTTQEKSFPWAVAAGIAGTLLAGVAAWLLLTRKA